MLASVCTIKRKTWMKISIIYIVFITLFLGGLIAFLKVFTLLKYPSDFANEEFINKKYIESSKFPQILHHSWKTEIIPDIWQGAYNACRSLNPYYTYMLWTDERIEEFMEKEYPWFSQQFHSYKYTIQKIDVFRYFILYHYGGVYIDLDIQCIYPFDYIIKNISQTHGMILSGTWPVGISNEFIIAKQYHPFLKFIVSKLQYSHHEYGLHYFTIMASTGPMFVSRCLETYPQKEDIYIVSTKLHKWGYFKHIQGDSWQWWDMWLVNWWVSWLITAIIAYIGIAVIVVKCCSNGSHKTHRRNKYQPLENGQS